MNVAVAGPGRSLPALADKLASNPDGILEQIAKEHQVSTFDVVANLPDDNHTTVGAEHFDAVMEALTSWGEVLFIVHTNDIVLECAGKIPPGSHARGYFNIHGDSPIGGHIKAENCKAISFIDRPFMGRVSKSIQFFNQCGEAMFKIFVRRDDKRELLADQVAAFDALRAKFEPLS